jgi:hypothetical protein
VFHLALTGEENEVILFQGNVHVVLFDPRKLCEESDGVLVFIDVNWGNKIRSQQRLLLSGRQPAEKARLTEKLVEAVLQ